MNKRSVGIIPILIVLIISIFLVGCGETPTGQTVKEEVNKAEKDIKSETQERIYTKTVQDCPSECCINGDYRRKDCNSGYDCINNACIAKDSDGDGLTDIEERNYGTSTTNADTDNDGLTDYIEVKVKGTSPTKANTDNDRYNDNEDPNPLVKNSADIKVNIINSQEEPNIVNIGLLSVAIAGVIATKGALTPVLTQFADKELYTYTIDIKVENQGNDYSNYVSFDLVYKLSGTEVKREHVSLGKLVAGDSINKHFAHEIKTVDVPEALFTMLEAGELGSTSQWTASIEGVEYEKI